MDAKELHLTVPQRGRLEWIGMAPSSGAEIAVVQEAVAEIGTGLVGEHHGKRPTDREVTLIQAEHLPVIASLSGHDSIDPALLRRNLLVSGINLASLEKRRFRVGEVTFEGTGDCPPCSRMEHNIGTGGYQAARGHGGICVRVIEGGKLRVGDEIVVVDP